MYFFVQKEQTFVQIFRKEGDVFPDFSRCFLGNTTSCDVEFQSDCKGGKTKCDKLSYST